MAKRKQEIRPQPGPQTRFLASAADIVVYGGSAGGGKTWAELIEPLRHVHVSDFNCVIFRRTAEQVRQSGGLWEASRQIYPGFGGKGREQQLDWRFPSGATIKLDSLQHEKDKEQFRPSPFSALSSPKPTASGCSRSSRSLSARSG